MLRFLFYFLIIILSYEFWAHPEARTHPSLFIEVVKDDAKNTLEDIAPLSIPVTQPPGISVPSSPNMFAVNVAPWVSGNYTFTPLYGYTLHARVLSKNHYVIGRETDLSAYDLALGWQQMSDSSVLSHIDITQSNRWYYYRWYNEPPIPPEQIPYESGNMHMIASNNDIAHTLAKIRKGNIIGLEGYLVQITATDGWKWVSGTSASAEGAHGCKVIWITKLDIEK